MKRLLLLFLVIPVLSFAQVILPGAPVSLSSTAGASAPPSGAAGGVLGGTYPNPDFGSFTSAVLRTALTDESGTGVALFQNGALGTPVSGTVTNLTGTASININGTVGATTPGTGVFTTLVVNSNAVTVTGATTLGNWFDQSVKTTATPLFAQVFGVSATSTGAAGFRSGFPGSQAGLDMANTDDTSGIGYVIFRKGDSTQIGSINRVAVTNAVVYNTTSDARLKTNIRDFTDSGHLIDSLRPRLFDWKKGDGKDIIGFIAQEENDADPVFARIGAVSPGDNDPVTINKAWERSDQTLVPILVAEVKSLRVRLAKVETEKGSWLTRGISIAALLMSAAAYFRRKA